jgi:hypothetical protein
MQTATSTLSPLQLAAGHAQSFLDGLDDRPVGATATLEELRDRLGGPLATIGTDASKVIEDLVRATEGGLYGCASGRFFAWVIGGALPSAIGADWLATAWDQNAALYACSPASSVVEEVAGNWVKDLLGLPADASFAFTGRSDSWASERSHCAFLNPIIPAGCG